MCTYALLKFNQCPHRAILVRLESACSNALDLNRCNDFRIDKIHHLESRCWSRETMCFACPNVTGLTWKLRAIARLISGETQQTVSIIVPAKDTRFSELNTFSRISEPLAALSVNTLPTVVFRENTANIQEQPSIPSANCPICRREGLLEGGWVLTSCQHLFHRQCLHDWWRYSNQTACPYCRQDIELRSGMTWDFVGMLH